MSSDNGSPQNLPSLQDVSVSGAALEEERVCSGNNSEADGGTSHPANKVCRVCGDKALGYNFNVVTCESCKAFFRRNALRGESKAFRCAFTDNCLVTVVSRRFCQKCRLRKCFEVGMKKDWIMSEDARLQKRMRIQENRKKKLESDAGSSPSDFEPERKRPASVLRASPCSPLENPCSPCFSEASCSDPTSQIMSFAETRDDSSSITIPKEVLVRLLTQQSELMKTEPKTPKACTCICTCGAHPPDTLIVAPKPSTLTVDTQTDSPFDSYFPGDLSQDFGFNMSSDDIVSSMLDAAINSEFTGSSCPTKMDMPSSPLTPGSSRDSTALSPRCQKKLNELVLANEVMKEPLEAFIDENKKDRSSMSLTDVINMTDIAIRRIIKMSKRINGFKSLCQEDQIALLKGGCTELMILRGVMTYDPERDSWKGPDGEQHLVKCEILKGIKGNVYEEHKRYLSSFRPTWRTNEPIMLMLGAITLFNPTRCHVQHRDTIKREHNMYYSLLKRYLESMYSQNEALEAYEELIEKIEDLHHLNDNVVRIFLDVNPKDVEPLLTEIFDLK